jgi:hypothetical protein
LFPAQKCRAISFRNINNYIAIGLGYFVNFRRIGSRCARRFPSSFLAAREQRPQIEIERIGVNDFGREPEAFAEIPRGADLFDRENARAGFQNKFGVTPSPGSISTT